MVLRRVFRRAWSCLLFVGVLALFLLWYTQNINQLESTQDNWIAVRYVTYLNPQLPFVQLKCLFCYYFLQINYFGSHNFLLTK